MRDHSDRHPPVRVGIIGGGFMAAVHSRAARAAGAILSGITASTPERSLAAAAALAVGRAYSTVEELVSDPEIDIIHVCTPNATHATFATQALAADKHVVCEKPLALDVAEAEALNGLAVRSGKVAAIPFVYRYHPMVGELRTRVARGDLGRLITVQGCYLQDWLLSSEAGNWRVDSAAGGRSRSFADIGSHLVDLIEFTTGERVVELTAATSIVHPVRAGVPVDTEDVVALTVRFGGGAIGTLLVSQTAAGHDNDLRIELMGTTQTIAFAQERPETLQVRTRGSVATISRGAPELSPTTRQLSLVPAGHPMGYQDAFNAFIRDVYQGVHGHLPERVPTFADGARMNQLTAAVLDSAATAAWISINECGSAGVR